MKKIKLLLLFILITVAGFAQQKKYIPYKVKSGENMRIIAKNLGISTRELLNLNPDVSRRPDAKTIIIIPNKNYGKQISETANSEIIKYHVNKKDTMFGIAKQFGITIEELMNANPELLSSGLKYGMTLLIPQKKDSKVKLESNYLIHTVVKDNTIYNLSKTYNVSQEDLLQLNPELKDGLKLGMQLKIKPLNDSIVDENNYQDDKGNNINSIKIQTLFNQGFMNDHVPFNKSLKVAFMLPYQLNKLNDSIKNSNFGKENSLLNIVSEFNLGANMAIDSLRQMGANIQVSYFDTENTISKMQKIISTTNFEDYNAVIGPLFFENALWLADHKNVPVFVPFYSKKQSSVSNINLIKTTPDTNFTTAYLFDYLQKKYNGQHIVLVSDNLPESEIKISEVLQKLNKFYPSQTISVVKPENGYIDDDSLSSKLIENKDNWVILVSNENITTAAAVNNLKVLVDKFKIILIALNKGSNFDTVENDYLAQLNFLFPTTDFLDTDNVRVKAFLEKYYVKNNTYPSKYAIRGFDVTFDTLMRILSYNDLEEGLEAGKSVRNASFFNYVKTPSGSFENDGVYLIQYDKNLNPILLN